MQKSLILPNRGVLFDATTADLLLEMGEMADASDSFDSVWVGDSLLGRPRLESVTVLAGIAARTRRVKLGTACMASFALRDPVLLAQQWASLDFLSGGRTILSVCSGLIGQEGANLESELYRLQPGDRVGRLVEWVKIMRLLWSGDDVAFQGKHYGFDHVTIAPKPLAEPCPPIWLASNAQGEQSMILRTLRRAARHGDGWQTRLWDPEALRWRINALKEAVAECGKDPETFPICLYHNINVDDRVDRAFEESHKFLQAYYGSDRFSADDTKGWCAVGPPAACIEHLERFRDVGVTEIALRITSWDQRGQMQRLDEEVFGEMN